MLIKITLNTAGKRLDKFLAGSTVWVKPACRSGRPPSRAKIQKMVKEQMIIVNNSAVSSHYNLKPGDIINVRKTLIKKARAAKIKKPALAGQIEIIDDAPDFLVINKPAGLIVHKGAKPGYALADWLKEKYPKIAEIGDDQGRPGIVHRLDKDVSGLMVIAKTRDSFNHLKKQFQDRSVIKEYTALVHGRIQRDSGLINFPIKRSREGYRMAALPFTAKGEPSIIGRGAITEFEVMNKFINYTLLRIKIKTGRTHQIRVHLAAYDHPVAGDNIYGAARARSQNKKLGLKRIFLIADHLCFNDLDNNPKDYKIDLNEELKNILKVVK